MAVTKKALQPFLKLNARKVVALARRAAQPGDTSYCGGYPTLPRDVGWPLDPDGGPCIFLAQFDLADLPARPKGFPAKGRVFVFLNAALEDCDDAPTSEPFVYFASGDQDFVETPAPGPIKASRYFWYTGDGDTYGGKSVSLNLDALPQKGYDFSAFTDYLCPETPAALTAKEAQALAGLDAPHLDIVRAVSKIAHKDRDKTVSSEIKLPSYKGGLELLDPEFKLRATWWGRPQVYEGTDGPLDPVFSDWPRDAQTLFHHAKAVAFDGAFGADTDNNVDPLARRIASEAQDWMTWAKDHLNAPALSDDQRAEYLAWCRRTYAAVFEAARPGVTDPPRVWKRFFKLRKALHEMLPKAMRAKREAIVSSHGRRKSKLENLSDPMHLAGAFDQQPGTPDQLFGYGENIQDEADSHRNRTLLLQSWGMPNVSFGDGNLKIWLAEDTLTPNAWQPVIALNSVT
jgi:hypothetical protein